MSCKVLWRIPRLTADGLAPEILARATESGVDGVEFPLTSWSESETERIRDVLTRFRTDGPAAPVVALAGICEMPEITSAVASVNGLLRLAVDVGAAYVDVQFAAASSDRSPTADSWLTSLHAILLAIRFEVEASGAVLSVEPPDEALAVGPTELRELIDRANCWAIGICLYLGHRSVAAAPLQWFRTLGRRICTVRLPDPPNGCLTDAFLERLAGGLGLASADACIVLPDLAGPRDALASAARLLAERVRAATTGPATG